MVLALHAAGHGKLTSGAGGWKSRIGMLCSQRAVSSWLFGSQAESTRVPFVVVIINSTVCAYLYWTVLLHAELGNTLHFLNVISEICMWVSFVLTTTSDPGYIDRSSQGLRAGYDRYFDLLKTTEFNDQTRPVLCHSCHIQRPNRAKHCRVCRRCVSIFDHHCPFVNNCVGRGNYRYFFVYCFFLHSSLFLYCLASAMYLYYGGWTMGIGLWAMWCFPFWGYAGAMVVFHTTLVRDNMTTNEQINFSRYAYLKDAHGNPHNPFDAGCVANVGVKFCPVANKCPHVQEIEDVFSRGDVEA
jgi:hypothetical protein